MLEALHLPTREQDGKTRWREALEIAGILDALRSGVGGIHLKARAGPVRYRWMDFLQALSNEQTPWQKITPQITADRLLGGIDIATTLRLGKPAREQGILERADNGFLVIAMTERLEPATAAIIARIMDERAISDQHARDSRPANFTVIAIDEGVEDGESIPAVLKDRLGLTLSLDGIAWHDAVSMEDLPDKPAGDRETCVSADLPAELAEFFSTIPIFAGRNSMRPAMSLCRVAKAVAASAGREMVNKDDAAKAVRFCLGEIALPEPPPPEEEPQQPPAGETETPEDKPQPENQKSEDVPDEFDVLTELASRIPIEVLLRELNRNAMRSRLKSGKAGEKTKTARRGRPTGFSTAPPHPEARPDILATIRHAVPWQKIRSRRNYGATASPEMESRSGNRLKILPSDFRYKRFKHNAASTAIFVVDASGSTAMERLGETKGAIELLLADCYIRRDQVGLITFRGSEAEPMLEPTRSLVRAKRSLAGMPGGGATPLPSGLRHAYAMAKLERQKGNTPLIVLLTDGSGNIALDGSADRKIAAEESLAIARQIAAGSFRAIVIDIARRPRPAAEALAREMQAEFITLPQANAQAVSSLVNARMDTGR